ncbi:uncharacterized protein LOC126316813 [Schistocerca gregaria]|uniref:uncharacterized protein LOC126316813 n=1 Tax=Schistocerca gregaria TaxID=7010 RepID=UPI00211F4519|nr:uncharacterized protein LOC126316813 [Schistocerca gregaria]
MALEASGSAYFKSAQLTTEYFSDLFSDFLLKPRTLSKHAKWQHDGAAEQPNTSHLKDVEGSVQGLSADRPQLSASSVSEQFDLPATPTEESTLHEDSGPSLPSSEIRPIDGLSYVPDGPIIGVNIESALETLRQKIRSKINFQNLPHKKALKSRRALSAKKSVQEKKTLSRRQLKNLKKRQKKEREAELLQSSKPSEPAQHKSEKASHVQVKKKGESISPKTEAAKNKAKGTKNKNFDLDINYGKLIASDSEEHAVDCIYPRSKRQLNEKRLEELTAHQEFMKKNPERQHQFKMEKAWDNTAKKLSGINPKDEIEVLKKTIKNKNRDKRRSARKWEERMKAVDANIKARQEKRAANIENRIKTLKEKKLLAILKRKQKKGVM